MQRFSVVVSVALRFFRNATNKSKTSLSLASSVLKGRALIDVFRGGDVRGKNVLKDDVQSSWNETC